MPTPTARPRHRPRSWNLLSSRAIAASEPPQHVQRRRLRASWCTNPGEQACSRRRCHSDKTGLGRHHDDLPRRSPCTPDTHLRKHTSNCRAVTCSPVGVRPGIPDVGLKGVSGPSTGIDRPSSVSSAGTRCASDEERGSIISLFALFANTPRAPNNPKLSEAG